MITFGVPVLGFRLSLAQGLDYLPKPNLIVQARLKCHKRCTT